MGKAGATRRGALGALVGAAVAPHIQAAELAKTAALGVSNFYGVARFGNEAAAIAAGEAATSVGSTFSIDDGSGNLIVRERTLAGSVEVARMVTPASLAQGDGLRRAGFKQPKSPKMRNGFEKTLDRPVDVEDYESSAELLDYERTTRRRIELGASLEVLASQLTLDLDEPVSNVGIVIEGRGWNLNTPALSSGYDGAALTVPILNLNRPRPSAINNNAVTRLQDFAVVGGDVPKTAATGQHGISGSVNGSIMDGLLVQYCGGHGLSLEHSYIAHVKGGLFFGNHGNGINILYAFNAGVVDQIRAYANGRAWTGDQGNIFLFGFGNSNYSAVIRDADVSYSGYVAWSMAAGTITSISVSAGVATVTTSAAHGRSTGDKIGVRRATIASSGTPSGLASTYGYAITVTGANTFTFPCPGVANSVFTAANMPDVVIGPNSHGLIALGNEGTRIEGFYCEDPIGPAMYLSQSKGVVIVGGFILNGDVIIEAVTGVEIGGMKFQGESRLITGETSHRAEINVLSSNVFDSPANWVRSAYFMMDGRRYGPAPPSNGVWQVGDVLHNSRASAGDPACWYCTMAGSPGTWQPLGIVGARLMGAVADPGGGAVVDAEARTAIGQILTELRSKNFMSS